MSMVTLTFDLQNQKGPSSHYGLHVCKVWWRSTQRFSFYRVHKLISIYVNCDLDLWPPSSKINRVHPLVIVNMSAKFDEEACNGSVSIVFTRSKRDGHTHGHTHMHARTEPQQCYYILSPTRCAGITTRQTEKNMTPINQYVGWKSMTYFENINFTVFLAWVLALQKAAKVQRINALQSSTGKKIHVPGNKISWNEMKWLHEPKILAVCTVTLTFEKWPWIKVKIKWEAQRSTYRAPEYNVPPFWQIGRGGNFYLLIGPNNTNMERRWGLASSQVSLNSVQQFQRRSLKCLSL